MRGTRGTACWLAMAALAAAGCGSGGDGSGPQQSALRIQKASLSGDQQTDTVQRQLAAPLRVLVTRDGAPEAGAAVSWSDNTPGASFREASTLTDAAGIASTIWSLGRIAGARLAIASVAEGGSARFTATALPDVAAAIAFTAGDGLTGSAGTIVQLQAAVVDQYGNRVPGTQVNWSVLSGDAAVSAPSTISNASGLASASLRFGPTTGPVRVQAAVTGLPVALANLTAVPPAALVDTVRLNTTGGARFSPATLTVAAGTTIVFKWESGTHDINPFGSLTFRSITPPVSAPHLEMVTLAIPGTYQFFCSVHGSQTNGMRGTIVAQ